MNPEDNNPLSNPFATGGMTGTPEPTAGLGGMPMSDNLASAQESLTAAGMAANQGVGGAIGLDQIAAADSNSAALPPVDEPLVPAAPVPGSIGSAVSMPPADPTAAPADMSFGAPASTAPTSGAVSAPEVAPAAAPFNPFATPSVSETPAAPAPAPQPVAGPATPTSAPQPAPAPVPMGADKSKSKLATSPLVVILGVIAALLLVTSITFFILWNNEKKNVKPVYYPQVSDENSNSSIASISCQRTESREDPAGSGKSIVTISYTGDTLSAYSSSLSLDFGSETDAAAVRDANAPIAESVAALVGGTLAVSNEANGNNYTYLVTSQDGTDIAASDVMNAIYGTTEGDPSLALADVQAKYEAEGFVCVEE